MKNTILLSLSICMLCFASCEEKSNPRQKEVTKLISNVKETHAPDKRVARFQVEAVAKDGAIILRGESNLPEAKADLLAAIKGKSYQIIDSIKMLPATELKGKIYGVVNLSACNIRSKPKHSAELGTQSTLGTSLRVHKESEDNKGWFLVQTPDDYFSWLDEDGFTAMNETAYKAWQASEKVVYLRDFGFSLAAPDEAASRVSDLLEGNILKLLEIEEAYAKVEYPDGRVAYIPTADVMSYELWLASRQADAAHILAKAKDFLGRPYLWGGTSGKGMDCSGFTKTVFYLNGVIIPRDASQQVHAGIEIETDTSDWKNLAAGDLLFFGRKATEEKKERITHVAIYMGDGKIIHSAGTVKIESLRRGQEGFTEYRLKSFIRAKRFLNHVKGNNLSLLNDSPHYVRK